GPNRGLFPHEPARVGQRHFLPGVSAICRVQNGAKNGGHRPSNLGAREQHGTKLEAGGVTFDNPAPGLAAVGSLEDRIRRANCPTELFVNEGHRSKVVFDATFLNLPSSWCSFFLAMVG